MSSLQHRDRNVEGLARKCSSGRRVFGAVGFAGNEPWDDDWDEFWDDTIV